MNYKKITVGIVRDNAPSLAAMRALDATKNFTINIPLIPQIGSTLLLKDLRINHKLYYFRCKVTEVLHQISYSERIENVNIVMVEILDCYDWTDIKLGGRNEG